jgi:hypothetical protein
VLAAAAALAPAAAWGRPIRLRQVPLSALSVAAFEEQLHTSFWVRPTGGGIVEMTLQKAESLSPSTVPARRASSVSWESFSLIFSGAPDEVLPQETYDFEHAEIGRFSMFVVPIGLPEGDEQRYQAIFSRLHQGLARVLPF